MNFSVFAKTATLLLCLARLFVPIQGGICWTAINKQGRCTDILSEKMTKEECCRKYADVSTAWTKEDLDSGSLFFLRILGGGVPCHSCKESCAGIDCGPGKRCVFRSGRPKCACSPCKEKGKNSRGPVCGTDGNTYLNVCRMKKRACRRRSAHLAVAYNGFCQSSCDRIECPEGKYCLLDQNLSPHCVRCAITCPRGSKDGGGRPVCGADGVTYGNVCLLRQRACARGKAIPVAYKGKCKARASCGSVRCKDRQVCLTDPSSGSPRCVTCAHRCPSARQLGGPICGSNEKTYRSWCHMVKDACATGFVIETKFQGACDRRGVERPKELPTAMLQANSSFNFSPGWVDLR